MKTTNYYQSFEVEPSQTSSEIAEAFGIEGGYKKEVVDVDIASPLPDVTYITGESGCGKTTLLEMMRGEEEEKQIPKDKPLWEWAEDTDTALEYLSKVGLGDATMFVSNYDELSDSQQYRAKLYHRILEAEEGDVLYFDEFLSTLDRKTAYAVSHLFQKVVRSEGYRVVCSTAHQDLDGYLQPDYKISGKAFPHRWDVKRFFTREVENPFLDNIEYTWEDAEWYNDCDLAELHYKGKHVGGIKDYLAAYIDGRLVGFLVGIYRIHDGGRRISRLVTHPSYRGLGIGRSIVSRYLEEEPGADVVAEMAKYNPVFERAGMERVEDSIVKPPNGLKTDLNERDFDQERWYKKSYCCDFMEEEEHREMLSAYAATVGTRITPGGKNTSAEDDAMKIKNEPKTAGRVLWNLRPKEMAKFVGPAHGEEDQEEDAVEEEGSIFDF